MDIWESSEILQLVQIQEKQKMGAKGKTKQQGKSNILHDTIQHQQTNKQTLILEATLRGYYTILGNLLIHPKIGRKNKDNKP